MRDGDLAAGCENGVGLLGHGGVERCWGTGWYGDGNGWLCHL